MALGDVYEKTDATTWTKRGNISGPPGGGAALLAYKRIGYGGPVVASAGAALIGGVNVNTVGGALIVGLQITLQSPGNVRAWLRVDGADVPGRFMYYPGYGQPESIYGIKVITGLTPGTHFFEPWQAGSNNWTVYDDAPTTLFGAGDNNSTFFHVTEYISGGVVSPVVTALPTSPFDGQEVSLQVNLANGIFWRMKWVAAAAKWIFLGGPPLQDQVLTDGAIPGTQTSYADIAGSGNPSVTLPQAGMYDVDLRARVACPAGGGR